MRTLTNKLRDIMMGFIERYQTNLIKRAVKITANKMQKLDVREYATGAESIANSLYVEFSGCRRERFFAYYIDLEGRIIKRNLISIGTANSAPTHIHEMLREAILCDAAGLIIAHTHIAHCSDPSDGDLTVTRKIQKALEAIDMVLYDHIIVSKAGYYSFNEEDILPAIPETLSDMVDEKPTTH